MNKYEITELSLKHGFDFDLPEHMNEYLYSVLKHSGMKTISEAHKKARAIYFRFLIAEKFKNEDIDFLNEKSSEFLAKWSKVAEEGNVNVMAEQLMTVESNQQLTAVIRLLLDIAKKNHLAEKAQELKQQKEKGK